MNGRNRFDGKVVIITGASQGIGLATTLAFAREGAIPILVSRSREKLDQAAEGVRRFNPKARVIPADVSSPAQVHDMVDKVLAEYGRIDVLVNNAGIARVGPIGEARFIEDMKEMMAVDVCGTVYCTQAVLPT